MNRRNLLKGLIAVPVVAVIATPRGTKAEIVAPAASQGVSERYVWEDDTQSWAHEVYEDHHLDGDSWT